MPVLSTVFNTLLTIALLLPTTSHSLQLLAGQGQYKPNAENLTLVNVYEPDCSWCYKQFLGLQAVYEHCANEINILSTGINGNKLKLREAVRAAQIDYPVVIADKPLKNKIGPIAATPTTIFMDAQGNVIAKLRGYIPLEKLATILQDSCPALLPLVVRD